jgi:hypothetical protein
MAVLSIGMNKMEVEKIVVDEKVVVKKVVDEIK